MLGTKRIGMPAPEENTWIRRSLRYFLGALGLHEDPNAQPKIHGVEMVYQRKGGIRLVAAILAFLFLYPFYGVATAEHTDETALWHLGLALFFGAFGLLALSHVSGQVVTDHSGIRKTVMGFSRSLLWQEISEIRINPWSTRVVFCGAGKKIKVDSTFQAVTHLCDEVCARTELSPILIVPPNLYWLELLLVNWKTNFLLGFCIWFAWKKQFWQDPLYCFTVPLVILLCSLPLIDTLIEYFRRPR